jgi:hypothetical protein
MQNLYDELPQLIVTVLLIVMITVLLVLHIIPIDSLLALIPTASIVPYWFLSGAYKWQGPQPPAPKQ